MSQKRGATPCGVIKNGDEGRRKPVKKQRGLRESDITIKKTQKSQDPNQMLIDTKSKGCDDKYF